MSAARYALLKLEQVPPHVKNWRPQILLFVKCQNNLNSINDETQLEKLRKQLSQPVTSNEQANHDISDEFSEFNIEVEHPNAFAFASQLKSGKGLFVCANVILGDFIQNAKLAKACEYV